LSKQRSNFQALNIWQKFAKLLGLSKKTNNASKYNRKIAVLLRMEIFGGTYMRLRYSPYEFS